MNRRLALYEQASRHTLDAAAFSELQKLAGITAEPPRLQEVWSKYGAIAGGALLGLGMIFFVAANWAGLGRFGRLGLVEAFVLLPAAGMAWRPDWKVPLGLLSFLAIGGLFASIGQTYQTGADPWQLFALWATLAIPLCLATRTDVLWLPWVITVTTAITLGTSANTAPTLFNSGNSLGQVLGWLANVSLVVALRSGFAEKVGVGRWSQGLALLLSIGAIAVPAASAGLHYGDATLFAIGLMLLVAVAGWLAWPPRFELAGLCAVILALNVLLDIRVSSLMFSASGGIIINFAVITCVVAGLVWASYALVHALHKRHAQAGRQR